MKHHITLTFTSCFFQLSSSFCHFNIFLNLLDFRLHFLFAWLALLWKKNSICVAFAIVPIPFAPLRRAIYFFISIRNQFNFCQRRKTLILLHFYLHLFVYLYFSPPLSLTLHAHGRCLNLLVLGPIFTLHVSWPFPFVAPLASISISLTLPHSHSPSAFFYLARAKCKFHLALISCSSLARSLSTLLNLSMLRSFSFPLNVTNLLANFIPRHIWPIIIIINIGLCTSALSDRRDRFIE